MTVKLSICCFECYSAVRFATVSFSCAAAVVLREKDDKPLKRSPQPVTFGEQIKYNSVARISRNWEKLATYI